MWGEGFCGWDFSGISRGQERMYWLLFPPIMLQVFFCRRSDRSRARANDDVQDDGNESSEEGCECGSGLLWSSYAATGRGGLRGLELAGSSTTAATVRLAVFVYFRAAGLSEALGRDYKDNEKAREEVIEHSFVASIAGFVQVVSSKRVLHLVVSSVWNPRRDCAVVLVDGNVVLGGLDFGRCFG